ncbi:hypothetical protein LTR62_003824 [Meristemomyces frigidus]|uniref:DUF1446-domain-containing protein n=1 Tax=Meristemomyces frigidus TaxID=1508187 RepID=A0AAN7TF17_9PEZI|nr:hypothetical protein LTR62_003824 [Meristemomyces frigidus]
MLNQAKYGPVDVITGDYLAEVNLGNDAEAYTAGTHSGWIPTAWQGLELAIDLIAEKRIKVIINGGALNPKGLAEETQRKLIDPRGLDLTVAYVYGDDCLHKVQSLLNKDQSALPHLDQENGDVKLEKDTQEFLARPEEMPVVSANAYLGMRAIKRGLEEGADIIICGRVADASPVIGAAAWWHGWREDDYDELAGALIAGHLIECSTYITGANYSGFFKHEISELLNLGLPIVEVEANGECVVTKHEALNGFVDEDTVKCQLLYELQGTIYLNSDVKADIKHMRIESAGKDRVRVSGVTGAPPPSTTKLAVFYKAGYQCELLVNASGYATEKKFALQEAQMRAKLKDLGMLEKFDVLDFQWVGRPAPNPNCQLASTTYLRIFAQARDKQVVASVVGAWATNTMQHFAGFHCSLDLRNAMPKPFLGFYPAVMEQNELEESVNVLSRRQSAESRKFIVGPPEQTEGLQPREDYGPTNPVNLDKYGETVMAPLGDVALGRSGDKGANVNCGLFVPASDDPTGEKWGWLRTLMTKQQMQKMIGTDWRDWYHIERCEMAEIRAVHFVVYGPLGRGVSSSKILDSLGKGFAEFIRALQPPFNITMGIALYDTAYVPQRTVRRHFMFYTARAQQAMEHQSFFFEQKAKLAHMLNTVGADAKTASFPACMEYPELTEAVTQLYQEACFASTLTFDQIQHAGMQMAPFSERVRVVEDAAADVRSRTMAVPKTVSRKRGRRDEEEDEEMSCSSYTTCNKRGRNTAADYDMVVEPSYCGPYVDRFLQPAWWTQVCE